MRTPNVSMFGALVAVGNGVAEGDVAGVMVGVKVGNGVEVGNGVFVGFSEGEGLDFGSSGIIPEKIRAAMMTTIRTTVTIAAIKLVRFFLGCICCGEGGGGGGG
jgi:hypothetical protein